MTSTPHDAAEYYADSVHQGLTPPGETKTQMDDAFAALGSNYRRSAESSHSQYQELTGTAPAPEPEPDPETVTPPPAPGGVA